MEHNIYFLFSILSLVIIAPFGAINPLIALAAFGIAGVFFFVWHLKEKEAQKKEQELLEKCLDKYGKVDYNTYRKMKERK